MIKFSSLIGLGLFLFICGESKRHENKHHKVGVYEAYGIGKSHKSGYDRLLNNNYVQRLMSVHNYALSALNEIENYLNYDMYDDEMMNDKFIWTTWKPRGINQKTTSPLYHATTNEGHAGIMKDWKKTGSAQGALWKSKHDSNSFGRGIYLAYSEDAAKRKAMPPGHAAVTWMIKVSAFTGNIKTFPTKADAEHAWHTKLTQFVKDHMSEGLDPSDYTWELFANSYNADSIKVNSMVGEYPGKKGTAAEDKEIVVYRREQVFVLDQYKIV